MTFFKSRFFLVALCVALALTIIPAVLSAMGMRDLVREAVQTVSAPFEWCVTKVYDAVEGFTSYFMEYDRLVEENEALKEQLREYEDALAENEILISENRWLRGYLSLKNEHIDYTFVDASVIARETGSYATVVTLNRGTVHGICVGMPVITDDGVFGYVKEVSYMSCKVVSIIETATAVGAFIERSGVTGLVEGDYSLREDGLVRMNGVAVYSDIAVGDVVYTSGTGSVYPRGLPIGTVISISADPYSRTLTAIVEPSVDFLSLSQISRFMIVTDYEIYSENVTEPSESEGADAP